MNRLLALGSLALSIGFLPAADPPKAEISNGQLRARIYVPDAKNGYYRGTRFDWSGVVYSLQYNGHDYYGPWFTKTNPQVHDFIYEGSDIVAGPCSAIAGPVDEFGPVGFDEAKAGGSFIKIGIGALRKPDDGKYDNYRVYDIAEPGKWSVKTTRDSITFAQVVSDKSSGYGYIYRKTLRLTKGKPEMTLEHSLKNTGSHAIDTNVYNHNFLVLDGKAPGPGLTITVPFTIQTSRPPNATLADVSANKIIYKKTLENRDVVTTPVQGFSARPEDNEIRIENSSVGMGMKILADRPLVRENLWSIRTVMAMEPFIAVAVEPGKEFTWKSTYEYYSLPAGK